MDKSTKILLTSARKYMQKRYNDIVTYLLVAEDADELALRQEAVQYLIDNEPYFVNTILQLKKIDAEKAAEAEYQAKTNAKKTAQEYMLEYINEQIAVNKEELSRTNHMECSTIVDIDKKEKKLEKLQKKLEELNISKNAVEQLIRQLTPEKRPVGRPKKEKAKEPNPEENKQE